MNNAYNLNNPYIPEAANDNVEQLEPNPSETLDLLSQATRKSALEVINTGSNLETLHEDVQDAHAELQRLSPQFETAKNTILGKINDQITDLNDDQKQYILDLIKAFHDDEDLKRVLEAPSILEGITEQTATDLVDHLNTDDSLQSFRDIYSEMKSKEPILQDAASTLLERNIERIKSESLRNKIKRKTGIHLDRNLLGRITLTYLNEFGDEARFPVKIRGLQANQEEPLLEIQYTNPVTRENVNAYISPEKLENVLFASKGLNANISSIEHVHNFHELRSLGLAYQEGSQIEFKSTSNGQINTLQIDTLSDDTLTLSQEVYINGERKSDLTFAEFSKWLYLHKGYPKINSTQLERAIPKLSQIYNRNIQPSTPAEEKQISLESGLTFTSKINNASIVIQSIEDNSISYTYQNSPITQTCSQFLQTLVDGSFLPEKSPEQGDTTQDESADNNSSNEDDDTPETDQPQTKEVSGIEFGGTPAILKVGTYTGAVKSILTLGGNITWFSYDDVAKEIIPKIVDNIKGSLETSNKLKLGKHLKDAPLIGEEFARMESGAKSEIVEDYTQKLNRIGDWKKVQDIIFKTDDVFEFVAATKFLKEKGYLPTFDKRYLDNVKKFDPKFTYPADIQKNRSIVDKNLIDFYDNLLDPGDGVRNINTNKSNQNSAIQEFARQSEEIFSENTNWGLTRLHKMLESFSQGDAADPHEYQGYLLGAYNSGEVDIDQLFTYIALGMTVKDKKGDTMLKGLEGLLSEQKKACIGFNMFLDGSQFEIYKFLQKEILNPDGSVPALPAGENRLGFEDRFGEEKANKIRKFMYWTNLTKTVSKKQNAYLKEGRVEKDFAGYSLFTHDYRDLKTNFVFMSGFASGRLTAEQVANAIKTFPNIMDSYAAILSEGPENYISDPGNFPLYEEKIKNAVFTYLLVEAGYTGRVVPGGNFRVGGTLAPDDMNGTKDLREATERKLRKLFANISNVSDEEIENLFKPYNSESENGSDHKAFTKNLEAVMSKVSAADIVKSFKGLN